jgi:membrane-anchored glycerophosphoryl diester phosphodiesterase (GDPDase)
MEKVLQFRKKRDFSGVISDTMLFIRLYFKPYFAMLGIIIGPAAVVGSILLAKFSLHFMDIRHLNQMPSTEIPAAVAGYFLFMLSYLLFATCTYDFVKVTIDKKGEAPTVEEVWRAAKKDVWKVLGIGLMLLPAFVAIVGLMVLMGSMMGAFSVFPIIAVVVFIFYAYVKLTLTLPAGILDDLNATSAISKSWSFVYGNFWPTFGISFIMAMIGGFASTIIRIPAIIVQVVTVLHGYNASATGGWSTVLFVSTALSMLASMAGGSLLLIGHALQYLSIAEAREGKGLMDQINELEIKSEDNSWGEEEY